MPSNPSDQAAEFDMLMAKAGLAVPDDLRELLLPGYAGLREQVALLRGPRTAASEPSNIFQLRPLAGG